MKIAMSVAIAGLILGPAIGAVTASALARPGEQGPQGLQGPQGSAGPAGPSGSPGVPGLDGTSISPADLQAQVSRTVLLNVPQAVDLELNRLCAHIDVVTGFSYYIHPGTGQPQISASKSTICALP